MRNLFNDYFINPQFEFGSIKVIESPTCIENYQLTNLTKDIMGVEWVKQFDKWAEHSLPKQPACYMVGDDKLVCPPSISKTIRDETIKRSKLKWVTSAQLSISKSPSYMMLNTVA